MENTLLERFEAERQKQLEVLSRGKTEKVINELMKQIREKDIFIDSIKSLCFYVSCMDFFGRVHCIVFSYTNNAYDEPLANSLIIGTYGEMEREEAINLLKELRKRLEDEGLHIYDTKFDVHENEELIFKVAF